MIQTLFCFCLQHPRLLVLSVYFDPMVDNLAAVVFHLLMGKAKTSQNEQIFLGIKVYLGDDIEGLVLLFYSALFLLKSSIQF